MEEIMKLKLTFRQNPHFGFIKTWKEISSEKKKDSFS